ncbi:hypothetical protein FHS86_003529 [Roseimarinus sediminis]
MVFSMKKSQKSDLFKPKKKDAATYGFNIKWLL